MDQEKGLGFYVVTMVVLGILDLLNSIIFQNSGARTIIELVFYVIGVVLIVWAGRSSKRIGGHPVGRGALMGAIYGLISGASAFFVTVSSEKFDEQLGGTSSSVDTGSMAEMMNSTGFHVLTFIMSIIIFSVLGLIVGAIGGATEKSNQ